MKKRTTMIDNQNETTVLIEPLLVRLGHAYQEKERAIKFEMAIVSILWLVGCPLLALLPDSGSDYGKPVPPEMCGLYTYSVSASMTGQYPKIVGSVMAPLFALLVVQRSSGSLCGILKLGWIVKYSCLIRGENNKKKKILRDDEKLVALKLWKRIEKIEYFGYLAACFLVGLVAFDSQNFLNTHDVLAILAFFSLCYQNHLVGALGKQFPDVFSNWHSGRGARIFLWGQVHLGLMFFLMYSLGTMHHFDRCDYFVAVMESFSMKIFDKPNIVRWLASVLLWYNEYAFAFMCIYVQLLAHYELRLWEFVGGNNMPYAVIISRFSFHGAVDMLFGSNSHANILLGCSDETGAVGAKVKKVAT